MVMDISVVICTWNNSKQMEITLEAISRCAIPEDLEWELVAVNNNCTDDTDLVVQKFRNRLPIKYIKESHQGLSRARNAGVQSASGKLVIFTDDDVKPCREWITNYWLAYKERPSMYFFGGPLKSEFQGRKPDEELLALAFGSVKGYSRGEHPKKLDSKDFFLSANWACPLEMLKISGGFDVDKGLSASSSRVRTGEEDDLMRRLRRLDMTGWYIPKAVIIHMVPEHKCNLRHIGDRWEAYGVDIAKERYESLIESTTTRRVPYQMYKQAFGALLRWAGGKLRGRKSYREYIDWRYKKGIIFGLSEAIRQRKKARLA